MANAIFSYPLFLGFYGSSFEESLITYGFQPDRGYLAQHISVRTTYDGTSLGALELKKLEEAGEGRNVRTIMLLSEAQKEAVVDYVTRGNVAQLTDRAFRDELISWIRFNPGEALRTGDGLSGRTSGHPALPTWLAKRIMGLALTAKGQAETDAANIRSSAGVAVFVSTRADKGSPKNKFAFSGVEAPAWQGARRANSRAI